MNAIDTIAASSIGSRDKSAYSVPKVIAWIENVMQRRRSRLALLEMSDDQLKDIGVSRAEAYCEANRPFWD